MRRPQVVRRAARGDARLRREARPRDLVLLQPLAVVRDAPRARLLLRLAVGLHDPPPAQLVITQKQMKTNTE